MSAERIVTHRPNGRTRKREVFDVIRLGSVIRWNKRLRTVREVSRYPDGLIYSVGFAKLVRSEYCGPLTIYFRTDIRAAFGGVVAHRKGPLCAIDVECRLSQAIENGTDAGRKATVTQDETVGVIW